MIKLILNSVLLIGLYLGVSAQDITPPPKGIYSLCNPATGEILINKNLLVKLSTEQKNTVIKEQLRNCETRIKSLKLSRTSSFESI